MNVIDALRMTKRGLSAFRVHVGAPLDEPESVEVKDWIEAVRTTGVHVIPDFYDRATCEVLRHEVSAVAQRFPDAVHSRSNGADRRVFGIERAPQANEIRRFADEPRLLNAARTVIAGDAANAFTLAGMITYREGNLGSGEGWHRDSFFNQFKALIYLTDVTDSNGPFEYVGGSHLVKQKISDHNNYGVPLNTSRVDDESVGKLISSEPHRHLVLTASMGTLVLADTTGIHRGMPLSDGERFALTNYYYPGKALRPKLYDHFRPVLGRHVAVDPVG